MLPCLNEGSLVKCYYMERKITFLICVFSLLPAVLSAAKNPVPLEEQLEQISEMDERRLEEEVEAREKRSEEMNELIDTALSEFYTSMDKYKFIPVTQDDEKVLKRIDDIEELKQVIQMLQEMGDDASVADAKADLEKSYEELQDDTYIATSLNGTIMLRGSDYNKKNDFWSVQVYSNILGQTNLFSPELRITYSEMMSKRYNYISTMDKEQQVEYENNIQVCDSFFRQAVPLLYLRVTYQIQKWKGASEYRFVPISCDVCRNDTRRVIKTYGSQSLDSVVFHREPEIEVRTKDEQKADEDNADSLIAGDRQKQREVNQKKVSDVLAGQHGRSALFVTADTRLTNALLGDFDISKVRLNAVEANVDIGIGKFFFAGGSIGYVYNPQQAVYAFGLSGGVNGIFWGWFRPFGDIKIKYHTDYQIYVDAGGGFDFIIGKLFFTIGYNYSWAYSFTNLANGGVFSFEDVKPAHDLYLGIGFTWGL